MLALYQYFGYDISVPERFKMIKAAGFDALGVWCDDWFGWSDHRSFPKLAREAGLEVIDGHAPFGRDYDIVNSFWLDNRDAETTFDIYLQTIKECAEDGVKNLIMHVEDATGNRILPPPTDLGIDRLKRLLDAAEKGGVCLALENITNHTFLQTIFDRIDSPNLGFCYDAGHKNAMESTVDHLSLFGNRLIALHLHDNNGEHDEHKIPFIGNIDWAQQMSAIAATGYAGPTTLECTAGGPGSKATAGDLSPEEWLAQAFDAGKRLEALRK